MPLAKYTTKEAYLLVLRELQLRAKRSGWNLRTAPKSRIADWLSINPDTLVARNRAYGISLDDIRTGSL
jgi:hypothetical protein